MLSENKHTETLEDIYLQILAASVPTLDDELPGFFVLADWKENRLRFIPPEVEVGIQTARLDHYVRQVQKSWAISEGAQIHDRILATAVNVCNSQKDPFNLSTAYLRRARMPLLGSVLDKFVLGMSTTPIVNSNDMPSPRKAVCVTDYPNRISQEHIASEEFLTHSVPVLVSEYIVGLQSAGGNITKPGDTHLSAVLAPVYALGQIRGCVVWFKCGKEPSIDVEVREVPDLRYLDKMFATSVTDIFIAGLLTSLGSVGQQSEIETIANAFSYLFLSTRASFFDKKGHGSIAMVNVDNEQHRNLIVRDALSTIQEISRGSIVLSLDEDVSQRLDFQSVYYSPAYSKIDVDNAYSVQEVWSKLINRKLKTVVISADQVVNAKRQTAAGSYRFVSHSLRNTIDRGLPIHASGDDVMRLLSMEKFMIDGMGELFITDNQTTLLWHNGGFGGESVGQTISQTLERQYSIKLNLSDSQLLNYRVRPAFVSLLIELIRNMLRHGMRGSSVRSLTVEMRVSERHALPHVDIHLAAGANVADARNIFNAFKVSTEPKFRGLHTINSVAKLLCCAKHSGGNQTEPNRQSDCGGVIWQFALKDEESESNDNQVSRTGPCTVLIPTDILSEKMDDFNYLDLSVVANGLLAILK